MPKAYAQELRPQHPYLDDYAHTVDYDTHFRTEADVKRAMAGYAGLVSALDENIGLVLSALASSGHAADTRVLYTSDHGDNVGARGPVGQVDAVRGKRRRAADHGGPGHRRRPRRRHAGVARRLRADDPRRDGVSRRARRRVCPARRCSTWPTARSRRGRSCPSITRSARSPVPSCCGSAAGSTATTSRTARSSSTSTPIPRNSRTSRPIRATADQVAEGERRLRAVLDPEAVDARAKRRQAELLASFGGREAALARGDLGFTPAPGTAAEIN